MDHSIFTGRRQLTALIPEGNCGHGLKMGRPLGDFLARGRIPDPYETIVVTAGQMLAVDRKCQGRDPSFGGHPMPHPSGVVPEDQVVARRGQLTRVGVECPDRFQVRQKIATEQTAVARPLTKKPRFLHRPERIVGRVAQSGDFAFAMEKRFPICSVDEGRRTGVIGNQKRQDRRGRRHGILNEVGQAFFYDHS